MTGTVKWFNVEKGYGFITREDKDYFVHWTEVNSKGNTLIQGQRVRFEDSGRPLTAYRVAVVLPR